MYNYFPKRLLVHRKKMLIIVVTLAAVGGMFLCDPIPQSLAFHRFADDRTFLGIRNFANVMSNLPFLFVGAAGFEFMRTTRRTGSLRLNFVMLFVGVTLTAFGSAYYHFNPNNKTLVWDRLPMTIVFMSFLSVVVGLVVNVRLGKRLLIPLVLLGAFSVFWWHYTEGLGRGDLRLYFLVQFYPMILIPLLLALYYTPALKQLVLCLALIFFFYALAKVFEFRDRPIYSLVGVSGHTLKHLAAAVSTWYFVVLYRRTTEGGRRLLQ